jgi:hypothetical protein
MVTSELRSDFIVASRGEVDTARADPELAEAIAVARHDHVQVGVEHRCAGKFASIS